MREISEATLAILKSQNLTGQNRFSHSLKLEGADFYSPISGSYNTKIMSATLQSMDFVINSAGKVLLVYSTATTINYKLIDTEEQMTTSPNIATGGTPIVAFSSRRSIDNFKVLRLKNGRILLIISDLGSGIGSQATIKTYISNNGLGTDFVYLSTAKTFTRLYDGSMSDNSVGKPIQLSNSRIIFHATTLSGTFSQDRRNIGCFVSDDNGQTWKDNGIVLGSSADGFNVKLYKNMVAITQSYLLGFLVSINSTTCVRSLDGGNTWSYISISLFQYFNNFADIFASFDGYTYLITSTDQGNGNLYRTLTKNIENNFNTFSDATKWETMKIGIITNSTGWGLLTLSPKGLIHVFTESTGVVVTSMIREEYSAPLQASSISISKGKGGSNTATIQASNKDGVLNPKNPDNPLYGILGTNKQIIIKQGYGEEMVETFTGMIDDFDMSTWPQTTGIALRDNLKKALDQTVTDGNQHTVDFASQPIENIVGYLCYLASIEVGTIEATGISVAMNFSWCSYADAFQQLGDLASFEWGCDSYGKFYFRRDYQPDNMFVAYTFEEGIDLATLKYKISDKDLYSKVVVFGKFGDTIISYEAPFLDAALYNILPQKILKIDATEASTMEALRKIAERAISMMQSKTAVIQFTSIAIPWLEVGDFIGIYERSTGAASIYRLSDLSFNMDKDSFTMSGTAYYYGDSIVPGELPTDIATQTVAPTVNLIPEMISNTAPSGVARASSIYTSTYEPWQAFNSHSDDYYWNSITNTGWIEYQFPEKTIVDKYMLKARQLTIYNDAMPRDWTFEGFDGEKWVVLDRQIGQTNWGVYQSRTYLFANTTAYSKYRLNVSRNDGYMRLQLEQLAMYYGGGA